MIFAVLSKRKQENKFKWSNDHDVHVNICGAAVSSRVSAYQRLMPGKPFSGKPLAEFLRPFDVQSVVSAVPSHETGRKRAYSRIP